MGELAEICDKGFTEGWTKELADAAARVVRGGEYLVCVQCDWGWLPASNRCVNPECRGFCTWGPSRDADPSSWERHPDNDLPWPQGRWRPCPPH